MMTKVAPIGSMAPHFWSAISQSLSMVLVVSTHFSLSTTVAGSASSSHCADEDTEAQEGRDLPQVTWLLHGGEVSWLSFTTLSLSDCAERRAMVSGSFPQTISFVPHTAAILAKGLLPAFAFETHFVPWGNLSNKEIAASPEIKGNPAVTVSTLERGEPENKTQNHTNK